MWRNQYYLIKDENYSKQSVIDNFKAGIYIVRWEDDLFVESIDSTISFKDTVARLKSKLNFKGKITTEEPFKLNRLLAYCLLQLDWSSLTLNYNTVLLKTLKNFWNLLIVVVMVLLFNIMLVFYRNNVLRLIFFNICWFFLIYWLLSTFIFLFKKSQYSIFTRMIQRFWKRSLYLFWLLEVMLFSIYLFLTLISPQEYLFVDTVVLTYNYTYNMLPFFKNIFLVVILILLLNLGILLWKYNTHRKVLQTVILLIFLYILQVDFMQFFYINQYYTNTVCKLVTFGDSVLPDTHVWNIEVAKLKRRTLWHYFFVLSFLKFWHTLFIVSFFLFFDLINIKLKHTSYNILSATLQNCYFLLFFTFILKIVLFKTYMNYLYEYVYYWFFVNNHFFDMGYMYHIFSIKDFLFVFYDFFTFFFN